MKKTTEEKIARVKSFAEAGRKLFGGPGSGPNKEGGSEGGEGVDEGRMNSIKEWLGNDYDDKQINSVVNAHNGDIFADSKLSRKPSSPEEAKKAIDAKVAQLAKNIKIPKGVDESAVKEILAGVVWASNP